MHHKSLVRIRKFTVPVVTIAATAALIAASYARPDHFWEMPEDLENSNYFSVDDTTKDTTKLHYPIRKNDEYLGGEGQGSNFDFDPPPAMEKHVELEPGLNYYRIYYTINGVRVGEERRVPFDEYVKEQNKDFEQDYFRRRSLSQNFAQDDDIFSSLGINTRLFEDTELRDLVDIRPQGSAELTFSYDYNRIENPQWPLRQQRNGQFKFDQKIQASVVGTIGDKIRLGINYDSDANFEFDNQYKLEYKGDEDQIIQHLEAGNINFPLPGTLIQGSQGLFGLKSRLKFGRLTVSTVFSEQKSERKEITLEGGARKNFFDISALDYDERRHYFLNHYFRDNYDAWMRSLPVINSPVVITYVEVYVTNRRASHENTRNIIGFMDLGEPNPHNRDVITPAPNAQYPANRTNNLYDIITAPAKDSLRSNRHARTIFQQDPDLSRLNEGADYNMLDNARRLNQTEFSFNPKLGYISLNQPLQDDEVLAVAYEYTVGGAVFRVGELARDHAPAGGQNQGGQGQGQRDNKVLFAKLLKGTDLRPDLPIWDLMMKNIYFLGNYQIEPTDFRMEVVYADDRTGSQLNYLPVSGIDGVSSKPLLRVLRLDQLNSQQEANPDGRFDYIENVTINSASGRIIFPVLEPFGSHLREQIGPDNQRVADRYVYQELYDSTKFQAEQFPEYNKFFLKGFYQSTASSVIRLESINVQEGSVRVTANGQQLQEGTDYDVNYTLGTVTIINPVWLSSGAVIKVSSESNTLFNIQQKRLIGTRLDYEVSDDLVIGGTMMYLREKPFTQKVNIGDEPINNVIYGFDGSYRTDSRYLTRLVDKIPLIETKELSEITVEAEYARLAPGHPKRVLGAEGQSYIDDFESSETPYDLKFGTYWTLASTPQKQPDLWPNGSLFNDLAIHNGRAKMAWYIMDPMFYRPSSITPDHIRNDLDMLSNHYMREVREREVFPDRQLRNDLPNTLPTFDLSYFPRERGPYNFDAQSMNADGTLQNPGQNWAGIMRAIDMNDFEAANVEYIEFWVMDPFMYNPSAEGGAMYLHLGRVSEDVMRDGQRVFENGLPEDEPFVNIDTTVFGFVPTLPEINDAFSNNPSARGYQDVGLDGMRNQDEQEKFNTFLNQLLNLHGAGSEVYQQALADPSGDDFEFFRGSDLDAREANIIKRYKNFNNPDGNSPTPDQSNEPYSTAATNFPDDEDISRNFTLDVQEDYFQYKIELQPDMKVGENYIVDKVEPNVTLANRTNTTTTWYQFRIPIREFEKRVGEIRDFKSIRFMRMMLTGFEDSVTLRFATLELIRGDWRRYLYNLESPIEKIPNDADDETLFTITTVNVEENSTRQPIPYRVPPDIQRELEYSFNQALEQNEQSLSLGVCNLKDGDARAAYKTTNFDVRQYKRLQMFVHAEGDDLEDNEAFLFMRLGSDLTDNYYEYEIPLKVTPNNTADVNLIWPKENEINIALEEFYRVKLNRNNSGANFIQPYSEMDTEGKGRITIVGSPELSNMRTIMIGVRNPKMEDNPDFNDNGRNICAEVWVNELRVTGFNNEGGWAANVRSTATLADVGKLSLAINRRTIGFGQLEENVQERSLTDEIGLDASAFFEFGRFFPAKAGIKIPFFYTQTYQRARPKFDPLNPDILMESTLDAVETGEQRDSIRYLTEDVVTRRSINFTNVKKTKTQQTAPGESPRPDRFYDIENFALTYIYSETNRRDVVTEYDSLREHKGILSYNYNFKSQPISPFKNIGKSPLLKPIAEFNFYLKPQSWAFRTEVDRRMNTIQFRNLSGVEAIMDPNFDKSFRIRRVYDLRHNFTKSLRFTYAATASSRIQEPYGYINSSEKRDSLYSSLIRLGTMNNFVQDVNLSYEVPISKFPLLDWIRSTVSYAGNYQWIEAPPAADSLGNSIQNSRTLQGTAQLNFVNFYNKVPFFKAINQNQSNVDRINKKREAEAKEEGKDPEDVDEVDPTGIGIAENASRILMSVRNANITYSRTNGTFMPGFMPEPKMIGNDFNLNAPGVPFAFGWQDDISQKAAQNGWLTSDTNLFALYTRSQGENLQGQVNIEPLKNFRITLTFNQQQTENFQTNFRYTSAGRYESLNPMRTGSYSSTIIAWPSALDPVGKNDKYRSNAFRNFEQGRLAVSRRVSEDAPIDPRTSYHRGYSGTSQDVVIPAFLAAYTGRDAEDVGLSPFRQLPAPNWRINYDGLGKLSFLEEHVRSIRISHSYSATYSVNNFRTNLEYSPFGPPQLDSNYNFVTELDIQQIGINEQLSPLIGVDVSLKKAWSGRFEFRKTRNLTFNFSNYQLTEVRRTDVVFSLGYRTSNFTVPFIKINRQQIVLENDLRFDLNIALNNNVTLIRRMDQDTDEATPTAGLQTLAINPVIDYVLNKNMTLRIFFKREITTPATSLSFPRKFTSGGFSIRYQLTP